MAPCRTGRRAASAALLALSLLAAPSLAAQDPAAPPAPAPQQPVGVTLDSVAVRGNQRLTESAVVAASGLEAGSLVTADEVRRAIGRLMETGNFVSVDVFFRESVPGRGVLVLQVAEQPLVGEIDFPGLESLRGRTVRDSVGLRANAPLDPQGVARAERLIREMLAERGVQLVSLDTALVPIPGREPAQRLEIRVREGNRLAIAEIDFVGNRAFSDERLSDAMRTSEEGFLWFRSGRFDREVFDSDLRENLPSFYASRGYIDFAVAGDSLVVDPATGKVRLVVEVEEGPQYRLGEFRVVGNSRYPSEDLARLFTVQRRSVLGLPFGGQSERERGEVFDQGALEAAVQQAEQLYRNEGYLFAQVQPEVERVAAADGGDPRVNVTWRVREGQPFYVRRISFQGNTTTHESVIRDRLWLLPGDLYNEDLVIQSYRSISGLGFFEEPLPLPDILPQEGEGVVDLVFHVQEKQTGNINFGTVLGGPYGGGLSGFLGYSQPNLFGQGKEASLRAEFGTRRTNFEASYSDPALFGTRNSGSISVFHTGDRFVQFDDGERTRTGAQLRFGVPVPGLFRTRAFIGYSVSRTHLDAEEEDICSGTTVSLFCQPDALASTLSLTLTRDTKNHPLFPTAGVRQSITASQTGGPLGGDGDFQQVTADLEWWVPAMSIGSGPRPIRTAFGLRARSGANFGDVSLFPFERFFLGGVQFGESLRGYQERTVTPFGISEACRRTLTTACLGDAFLVVSAEYAVRVSDALSVQAFADAGNAWNDVQEVDPSRLVRGAGVGATLVTPFLGAIGIDLAYGFDRPEPQWEVHFKLGSGF